MWKAWTRKEHNWLRDCAIESVRLQHIQDTAAELRTDNRQSVYDDVSPLSSEDGHDDAAESELSHSSEQQMTCTKPSTTETKSKSYVAGNLFINFLRRKIVYMVIFNFVSLRKILHRTYVQKSIMIACMHLLRERRDMLH